MTNFHKINDTYTSNTKNFNTVDEFRTIKQLGKGGYSTVYLVEHLKTKSQYALKCADKYKNNKNRSHRIYTEIQALEYLDHPNIVRLEGWFEDEEKIYLVLEYKKGKDLNYFFRNYFPCHKDAVIIIRQLIEAVRYCHDMGVIHRDIKMDNLLIDKTLECKLTDFGLCTVRENENEVYYSQVGTVRYTAPEMLNRKGYDESVDVWGVGIVIFVMLSDKFPFESHLKGDKKKDDIFRKIRYEEVEWERFNFDSQTQDLLSKILIKNPNERLTLDEILEHPWFNVYYE